MNFSSVAAWAVAAVVLVCGQAGAKSIRVENDASQSVASVSFEVKDKKKQKRNGKAKKEARLDLPALPEEQKKLDKENRMRAKKAVEVDVSDEPDIGECFADVSFTMGNGQVLAYRDMDLCGLDAIVIEDMPDPEPLPVVTEAPVTGLVPTPQAAAP